jgi:hypothetical protein
VVSDTAADRARLAEIRDLSPMHWFDCDRFEVWDHGARQGRCDCTGDRDLTDLLRMAEDGIAAREALARVEVLIDPEAGWATNCWRGVRHIDAEDIRRAITGEA